LTIESRRTPCVGICSTTYGDLVCRGCRRFAHEIVAWNGYTDAQRARVWERLVTLRDAATDMYLEIVAPGLLDAATSALPMPPDSSALARAYELLRRRARVLTDLGAVGLRPRSAHVDTASALRDAIDAEFHRRSVAVYEHSFHVVVE
jgi:hypothetical protein